MSMFLRTTGIPIVLGPIPPSWPSSGIEGKGRLRQLVLNRQFKSAAAIIVPTPASLAELPHEDRIRAKVQQVNYGIDTRIFSPVDHDCRAERTILFFANLIRRKGIFTLLNAFEQVASQLSDVRLVIAGDGPDEGEVRAAVAAHAFSNRIDLIGRVTRAQAPKILRSSTVYCLPSYGEPFGMTALEAMSCGRPLVVTNAGGLALLVPNEGGRKVPPQDAAALGQALIEVLRSRELRERMGRVNRAVVERDYAWERVISRWEGVYRGLCRTSADVGTAAVFEAEG
jgi:glycosyltransferase involved in cell wall biosynthesis